MKAMPTVDYRAEHILDMVKKSYIVVLLFTIMDKYATFCFNWHLRVLQCISTERKLLNKK